MATIIDALLVTIGLDPAGFKSGAKDADKALKDTKDNAGRTAKELEAKGKQAAQFFGQIRNQVIALAATFTAGAGLRSFISEVTATDAAVGRTARNIGVSTELLSAWQGVAERAGGSAAGIAGSMQGLSQQFQQLTLTGQSAVVPYFRAIGVSLADANGKLRPMSELLLDLSDKFSKLDPARAQAIGRGMGLDEGTINVLMQGRTAISALLAEQGKLGAANKADADAAAKRQATYRALGQASDDLGRKLLTTLTPAINAVLRGLTWLTIWLAAHPKVFAVFAGAIGLAAAALTIALNVLALRGFVGLVSAMLKVPAAAAVAGGAMQATAATTTAAAVTMTGALGGVLLLLGKIALAGYAAHEALKLVDEHDDMGTWIDDHSEIAAWLDNQASKIGLGRSYEEQRKASQDKKERTTGVKPEGSWEPGPQATEQNPHALPPSPLPVPPLAPAQQPQVQQPRQPIPPTVHSSLSSNAAVKTPEQREFAQSDVRKLIGMGWTREQATGIAANIQRESGGKTDAVGDNGKAFGLAQWHPDRQADFEKLFGKKIQAANRDEQLAFINFELREGKEKRAGDALAKTTDAAAAAQVISTKYERPADTSGEALKRAGIALSLFKPGPQPDPALQGGAATAVASNVTNNNTSGGNTSSSEVHIGTVQVNAPAATDAEGIAKGITPALRKNMGLAAQANYGLT